MLLNWGGASQLSITINFVIFRLLYLTNCPFAITKEVVELLQNGECGHPFVESICAVEALQQLLLLDSGQHFDFARSPHLKGRKQWGRHEWAMWCLGYTPNATQEETLQSSLQVKSSNMQTHLFFDLADETSAAVCNFWEARAVRVLLLHMLQKNHKAFEAFDHPAKTNLLKRGEKISLCSNDPHHHRQCNWWQ